MPSCLLHSHSSHLLWPEALHGSPGPIEEQSSQTGDHVVPGGAQGSVQGGHSGPAPAPPGRGHASLWGSCILWWHPSLREWAVSPAGHQHPGPCQDQVRAVKTLGEGGAGSTRRHWRCHNSEPSLGPPGPERSRATCVKPRQERSRIQEGFSGSWEGGVMIMKT